MIRLLLLIGLGLCACSRPSSTSQDSAVEIPVTAVKWQSIGNCWTYGALGWAEAVVLRDTGASPNYSETYITYRHFQEQLSRGATKLETGGSFAWSRSLIGAYGLINEGDFIPGEASASRSSVQENALAYLENSMKQGSLSRDRSEQTIQAELDNAFGVTLSTVQDKIFAASSVKLATGTLWDEMNGMRYVYYPGSSAVEAQLPIFLGQYSDSQLSIQRRVMKALVDGKPVVVNWFVDFNALSNKGVFSITGLTPGRQGYHSVVMTDFTAAGKDENGKPFVVGEGPVGKYYQDQAVKFGHMTSLIIKNSWGGSDRPDRPSYTNFDGEAGFAKLLDNYAFGAMKEMRAVDEDAPPSDQPPAFQDAVRGVQSFVLPAGY
jgi:hypothetical protein